MGLTQTYFTAQGHIVTGDTTPVFQERQDLERPDTKSASVPDVARDEVAAILTSAGEAFYAWDVASDALTWSGNVGSILANIDVATIANGRAFAQLLDPENIQTRFDAVMHSAQRDFGTGVPYQVEYCLMLGPEAHNKTWVEDTGRWFAGPEGKPLRAHGVIRIINERHAQQERLAFLSRYDGLTGEMNRWNPTDVLGETLQDAIRFRPSSGFLLVAIDNLARINEAYGFDVADQVIAAVAKRIRSRMRGGDTLGRFSGNKFGVVLRECTPDDMAIAADRLLAGVRDEVVKTSNAMVAVTATIGGVAAPRHALTVPEMLARAQEALDAAKTKRKGSFFAYRPNPEREETRRGNARATDEIVSALNERRILLAFEPVVAARSRKPAFYECLMRIRRADASLLAAGDIIPVAENLGLIRLIDHRVVELVVAALAAAPELKVSLNVSPASTMDPDWWDAFAAQMRRYPGMAERIVIRSPK